MFKQYWRNLKQTWKPATLMYIIAVIINLITGWSMKNIIIGIFAVFITVILIWSLYVFIKIKSNKN